MQQRDRSKVCCVVAAVFQRQKRHDKALSVGECNNTRPWGMPPAARGQRRFGGGSPDAAEILQLFIQKYAFLGIF